MVLDDIVEKAVYKTNIIQADVDTFAELTGDYNPIHFEDNPIVHGMLTTAFVSYIIGMCLPGNGALLVSQSFDYLLPVRVGDTLQIVATVTQRSAAMNAIIMSITITNQNEDQVVIGKVTVRP